jgi:hypothetical protein
VLDEGLVCKLEDFVELVLQRYTSSKSLHTCLVLVESGSSSLPFAQESLDHVVVGVALEPLSSSLALVLGLSLLLGRCRLGVFRVYFRV